MRPAGPSGGGAGFRTQAPPRVDAPAWLIDLGACASTNAWALERLSTLAPGTAVQAQSQSQGRGRDGRRWCMGEGALAASVVVAVAARAAPAMALVAGLATMHALDDLCPQPQHLRLKWPNDVRTPAGKLAGVLCEGSSAVPDRLVVGIGVNLAQAPVGVADAAAVAGPAPSARALLERLRSYVLEAAALVSARGLGPLMPDMRRRDALLGAALRVERRDGILIGHGAGIDDDGRLLVMTRGGVVAVDAGHVVLE